MTPLGLALVEHYGWWGAASLSRPLTFLARLPLVERHKVLARARAIAEQEAP